MAVIKSYTKEDGSTAYKFNAYLGIDPMTGKKKRTTRQGFKTQKEAKLALSRLLIEIEENGFKKSEKYTFADLYELWFESAYKNTVKESTYVKTRESFRLHILPKFGHLRLEKITVTYCQTTVNDWCKTLAKYRAMKNYVTRIFDYAITLDLVESNPMRKISMPTKHKDVTEEKIENFYTKEELQHFFSCLQQETGLSRKWFVLFRLLAFSGMRKGEALALQWKDIDFTNETVTINKTVARGENNALVIQTPKTAKGVRTIVLDKITLSILKKWRTEQATDYLKLGFNTMKPTQPIFTTIHNNYVQLASVVNRLNKIIIKHDLKRITVHGFRHTHCSLLFEAGASIQEVKERLGHSDIKTTMNIYTHVTKKAKEETAEKFANYVNF